MTTFKPYLEVELCDGRKETNWARKQKTICGLPALRELLSAANCRYLEFISAIDDARSGIDKLNRLSNPAKDKDRSFLGLNFFDPDDQSLFKATARDEYQRLLEQKLSTLFGRLKSGPNFALTQTPPSSWIDQEYRTNL